MPTHSDCIGSERFYTVSEISQMLKVNPKTVYRLIERGHLKASSAIRHKRVYGESLAQFVNTTVYGGAK